MTEAFRPRRHIRMSTFTEPALVVLSKTTALEKLGTWKLVTDAF